MVVRKKVVLASASQRRKVLLKQIGLSFDVVESNIAEIFDPRKSVQDNVQYIAYQKAASVASSFDNAIIIGADTVVVLGSEILTKPKDADDARRMLMNLSGNVHEVFTGLTLLDCPSNKSLSTFEMTKVKFRTLSSGEIDEYIQSGSPMDKAGAYGIQDDYGAVFVERVEGCFYNVVGFPLARFYVTMREFQKQLGLL